MEFDLDFADANQVAKREQKKTWTGEGMIYDERTIGDRQRVSLVWCGLRVFVRKQLSWHSIGPVYHLHGQRHQKRRHDFFPEHRSHTLPSINSFQARYCSLLAVELCQISWNNGLVSVVQWNNLKAKQKTKTICRYMSSRPSLSLMVYSTGELCSFMVNEILHPTFFNRRRCYTEDILRWMNHKRWFQQFAFYVCQYITNIYIVSLFTYCQ